MKTKHIFAMLVAVLTAGGLPALFAAEPYTVHEWGTFTSFQGGDGVLLSWKPLRTSQLPTFVYNWMKPGLDRRSSSILLAGGKGGLATLQRMETPVVYFYSDKKMAVDISVGFPAGYITEWFPQATMIGPSVSTLLIPSMDGAAAINSTSQSKESMIKWSQLEILPRKKNTGLLSSLPASTNGSHYFAARDTDSDFVRSTAKGPSQSEIEKFLFYRGAGNFETPLRVTMPSDDTVVIANTGKETLSHLIVVNGKGNESILVYVPELRAGKERSVDITPSHQSQPGVGFPMRFRFQMTRALTDSGLFPREASAMVDTWGDSWFTEDGVRVLYTLPRGWTDTTLPMTLNPAPKQVVRVMVGRAEVLPPGMEHSLATQIEKARQGDAAASAETRKLLKGMGRFAEPAFYRALQGIKPQPQEQGRLMMLLSASQTPN